MQTHAKNRYDDDSDNDVDAEDGLFGLLPLLEVRNGREEVLNIDLYIFSEHIDCNFDFLCIVSPHVGLAVIGVQQRSQLFFDLLVRQIAEKEHTEKEGDDDDNGKVQKNLFYFA